MITRSMVSAQRKGKESEVQDTKNHIKKAKQTTKMKKKATTETPSRILAVDCSGSTSWARYFDVLAPLWSTELNSACSQDSGILLWDHDVHGTMPARHGIQRSEYSRRKRFLSKTQFESYLRRRQGYGGTDIHMLALYLKEKLKFGGELILVTDGQVALSNVERADGVLCNHRFTNVVVHLIGSEQDVNMSVAAPFLRNSPGRVEWHETSAMTRTTPLEVTREIMAIVDDLTVISSVDMFEAVQDRLEDAIRARTVGRGRSMNELRAALLDLQRRLEREYEQKLATESRGPVMDYERALARGDVSAALQFNRQIVGEAFGVFEADGTQWRQRLHRMISMCTVALQLNMSVSIARTHDRGMRKVPQSLEELATLDNQGDDEKDHFDKNKPGSSFGDFVCDISLERDVPAILLVAPNECDASTSLFQLFANRIGDKAQSILSNIAANPLTALHNVDLIECIVESLDHTVGVASLQNGGDAQIEKSPMTRRTRRPGALCLGADEKHAAATDWALAQLLNNGRMPGSADLWFAVLFELVETHPKLNYLREKEGVLASLRAHMRYRLHNRNSRLWLTGLPGTVPTRVRLGAAVWAVLASPPITDVPLRIHLGSMKVLQRLVATDGSLPSVPRACQVHAKRLAVMTAMQRMKATQKGHLVEQGMRALQANVARIDLRNVGDDVRTWLPALFLTPFVPLDGNYSVTQNLICEIGEVLQWPTVMQRAPRDVLMEMDAITKEGLRPGAIRVPFKKDQEVFECNGEEIQHRGSVSLWPCTRAVLEANEEVENYGRIVIHPNTCRPVYVPAEEAEAEDPSWRTSAYRVWRSHDEPRFLSMNQRFGEFCVQFKRYPSKEDFVLYVYKMLSYKEQVTERLSHLSLRFVTLQLDAVERDVTTCFKEFEEIMNELPVDEFCRRFTMSRKIDDRIRMECTGSV